MGRAGRVVRCAGALLALAFLAASPAAGQRPAAARAGSGRAPASPAYDVLIRGGTVIDGTGAPGYAADVALEGGRIARVSRTPLDPALAAEVVDARGRVVTPGFFDAHAHIEQIDRRPLVESEIRQGVTTVIYAADGGMPWPFAPFLARLEKQGIGPNAAFFAGHNTARERVMGTADRAPTAAELARMEAMVDTAMRAGAIGLSSGLRYVPATYATTDEVIALAKVAARYHGMYSSHMRDEGAGSIEAVKELIRIAREGGLPGQITHHKLMGQPQWGESVNTLALVDSARAAGVDITLDQYPYDATSTSTAVLFPSWALAGGPDSLKARLARPAAKDSIVASIKATIVEERGGGDLSRIQMASVPYHPAWNGLTFADIAKERGQAPTLDFAAALAIEIQTHGGASGVWHVIDETDLERIMRYPWTMVSSDGAIGVLGHAHPHPRNYGAHARVLAEYVRDRHVLTLEEAVRKMTSLPAWRFGRPERGRIAEGLAADLAVFDPARVQDRATYADPHRFSVGIDDVWVNGVRVLRDGSLTGARPGKVLRGRQPVPAMPPMPVHP